MKVICLSYSVISDIKCKLPLCNVTISHEVKTVGRLMTTILVTDIRYWYSDDSILPHSVVSSIHSVEVTNYCSVFWPCLMTYIRLIDGDHFSSVFWYWLKSTELMTSWTLLTLWLWHSVWPCVTFSTVVIVFGILIPPDSCSIQYSDWPILFLMTCLWLPPDSVR